MSRCRKYNHKKKDSVLSMPIKGQPVVHTSHSFNRWNSGRINGFPSFDNAHDLDTYVQEFLNEKKFEHIYKDYYMIDDEIITVLDVRRDVIMVVTYIGNKSQSPALSYNPAHFLKNMGRYGKLQLNIS